VEQDPRQSKSRADHGVTSIVTTWKPGRIAASCASMLLYNFLAFATVEGSARMNRTQKKNGVHRAQGAGKKARHNHADTVAMTLRGLRESVGRTQGEVARKVSMTQPQLSRVEARNDHLISTLRRYVHALGGEIEVVAVVNGARIALQKV
jgi:hypothetical protein